MAEAGRGFLEEVRNKMREKRGLGREEAERESEMIVASSVQLTARKEGVL